MRLIAQIVAVATTNRQSEKLAAIEAEPQASGLAVRSIDDDRMACCPSECGFGAGNVPQVYT